MKKQGKAPIQLNNKGYLTIIAMSFIIAMLTLFSSFPMSIITCHKSIEEIEDLMQAYYTALTGLERFKDYWDIYLDYYSLDIGTVKNIIELQNIQIGGNILEKVELHCLNKIGSTASLAVVSTGRSGSKKMTVIAYLDATHQTDSNNNVCLSSVTVRGIQRQLQ